MQAAAAVEKISMLIAVVVCRLTCTIAIVTRISASRTQFVGYRVACERHCHTENYRGKQIAEREHQ